MKTFFTILVLLLCNVNIAQQSSQEKLLSNDSTVAVQSDDTIGLITEFSSIENRISTKKTSVKTIIKPFEFSSLKKALKTLKPEEILVIVNESKRQDYEGFIGLYNNGLNNLYAEDFIQKNNTENSKTKFKFYFINSKDSYWTKKLKLQSGVSFVNKFKDVIYQDTNGLESVSQNFYFLSDMYTEIEKKHYLSLLDSEIENPKLSESQLIKVLSKINSFAYDLPKYGYGVNEESFSEGINNEEYKLRATPEQVSKLMFSLINKHKRDISLDYQFANFLLEEYVINNNFFKLMVDEKANKLTDLDFKVINYIAWFSEEIEKEMMSKNSKLSRNAMNYMGSVLNLFTIADNTATYSKEIQSVFGDFLAAKNNNPDIMNSYVEILNTDTPEKTIEFFDEYFASTCKSNKKITEQFDVLFKNAVTSHNWIIFRQQFAHTCNLVAKKVYEEESVDFVNKAIVWSKASLELQPNEPMYLNTLAKLHFLKGDENNAVKTQERAIEYASKSVGLYAKELSGFKEELIRMKNK